MKRSADFLWTGEKFYLSHFGIPAAASGYLKIISFNRFSLVDEKKREKSLVKSSSFTNQIVRWQLKSHRRIFFLFSICDLKIYFSLIVLFNEIAFYLTEQNLHTHIVAFIFVLSMVPLLFILFSKIAIFYYFIMFFGRYDMCSLSSLKLGAIKRPKSFVKMLNCRAKKKCIDRKSLIMKMDMRTDIRPQIKKKNLEKKITQR